MNGFPYYPRGHHAFNHVSALANLWGQPGEPAPQPFHPIVDGGKLMGNFTLPASEVEKLHKGFTTVPLASKAAIYSDDGFPPMPSFEHIFFTARKVIQSCVAPPVRILVAQDGRDGCPHDTDGDGDCGNKHCSICRIRRLADEREQERAKSKGMPDFTSKQPPPNDRWCVGCSPDNCSGCL